MHVNNKNLIDPFRHPDFIEFRLCIESSRTLCGQQNGGRAKFWGYRARELRSWVATSPLAARKKKKPSEAGQGGLKLLLQWVLLPGCRLSGWVEQRGDGQQHPSGVWSAWDVATRTASPVNRWVTSGEVHQDTGLASVGGMRRRWHKAFLSWDQLLIWLWISGAPWSWLVPLFCIPSAFVEGEQVKMFCKLCCLFKKYHLYGTALFGVVFYIQNIEGFRIEEEKLHIGV